MLGESGYERIENNFYPTEPIVTRSLTAVVDVVGSVIYEPCAGDGAMAEELMRAGAKVVSTDLIDRGYCAFGVDFLKVREMPRHGSGAYCRDIFTNPPYEDELTDRMIAHALELTRPYDGRVAMLLRHEFDCAVSRRPLFAEHPAFASNMLLHRRPRWSTMRKGKPRHNFDWFLWDWRHVGLPTKRYLLTPGEMARRQNRDLFSGAR